MKQFLWVCVYLFVFCFGFYWGCNYSRTTSDTPVVHAAKIEISANCADAVPVTTTIITNIDGNETRSFNISYVSKCVCSVDNGINSRIDMNMPGDARFNAITAAEAVANCNEECLTLCQNYVTNTLVQYSEFLLPMNW